MPRTSIRVFLASMVLAAVGCGAESGNMVILNAPASSPAANKTSSGPDNAVPESAAHTATTSPTLASVLPETPGQPTSAATSESKSDSKPYSESVAQAEANSPEANSPAATAGSTETGVPAASGPQGLTKTETPSTGDKETDAVRKIEVLIKEKQFRTEKDGALRVSYDDLDLLKVLNMRQVTTDAVELMPDWLKNLNGKRVRIRGFMVPPSYETGISRFVFARDTGACCFGPNPTLYYLIDTTLKPGVTTRYLERVAFDVVGTFRIKMGEDFGDGLISGLYYLDDAVVIER